MLRNLFSGLMNIFNGRYGFDNLSFMIAIIAIILMQFPYMWSLGLAAVIYVFYRAFSRNINRRYDELHAYYRTMDKIKRYTGIKLLSNKIRIFLTKLKQRKTHVFVKCSKCKNTLRLPKGKGKIKATCPVCKYEFIRKT